MKNLIGYPLDYVLNELKGENVEIIYNTQKDNNSLYVTNIIELDNKIIVTVSNFKIEV